jgi:uncharacterized membrane protein
VSGSGTSTLDRNLAWLLRSGTWAACITIAAGLALELATGSSRSRQIVTCGIVLMISLPVLRVLLMLATFLVRQEYVFTICAVLVLAIIATALALGAATP